MQTYVMSYNVMVKRCAHRKAGCLTQKWNCWIQVVMHNHVTLVEYIAHLLEQYPVVFWLGQHTCYYLAIESNRSIGKHYFCATISERKKIVAHHSPLQLWCEPLFRCLLTLKRFSAETLLLYCPTKHFTLTLSSLWINDDMMALLSLERGISTSGSLDAYHTFFEKCTFIRVYG